MAIAGLAGVHFRDGLCLWRKFVYTLGFIFAYYLFYTSFFIIGALCPWCLLVTATTTFVWFAITRYNIREGNLYLSKRWSERAHRFIAKDYDKLVLFTIVFVLIAAILFKYGNALFA